MGRKKVEINPVCAKNFKMLLEKENITQKKLAKKIHYTEQHVSLVAQGERRLTEDMARRIIQVFPNYRFNWLMGYDKFPTEEEKNFYPIVYMALKNARKSKAFENFFNTLDIFFEPNAENSDMTTEEFAGLSVEEQTEIMKTFENSWKSDKAYVVKRENGDILGYISVEDKIRLMEDIFDYAEFKFNKLVKINDK